MDIQAVKKRYASIVMAFAQSPEEQVLVKAADLGREMVSLGLPPEEIAEIHEDAIRCLGEEFPDKLLLDSVQRISAPLMEMLMAYGLAFRRQQDEREEAAERLRKSEELWNRIFNSSPDVITLHDTDLRIIKANQATCTFLDLSSDEIIGQHCYELFEGSDEPCRNCPLLQIKETFVPCSRDMYYEKLGKNFLVSAAPIFDEQGEIEYFTHVAKDISEMKKLETQLQMAQKLEAVGTLAGGIAHDFNNILSAIIGYSELIKHKVPEGSNVSEDIAEVIVSGKRAADLVKQILTFSRRADMQKLPLSPHLIVKEALKMLRATLPTTISIEEDIDSDCGLILAAPTSIHQITVNLCTNALHAMTDQKGTLNVSLQRQELSAAEIGGGVSSSGPFVVLSVSDTGCGMDEPTIERIFDPYFTTKEIGKGTGLGLAVIHGIVHDAEGFIRVESTPGEGSSFSVYLPVLPENSSVEQESGKKEAPPQEGSEHILVVDDEPLLVRVTQRRLEMFGYRVTATTNSKDALEKITTAPEQFDLLITDQTMPGLTGAELVLAAKEIKPDLRVILCTGHSDILSQKQAMEIGIKNYIMKPVVGDELFRIVRSVLDEI